MRRFPILSTAAAVLAGVLIALSPSPASAYDGYPDVWGLTAADRVINSDSCRYVKVTARTNLTDDDILSVDTEVWSRGKNVGSVSLDYAGSGRLAGRYYHCPYLDGIGKFRLGPTEISVWDEDYNADSFMDYSRGHYAAKQASRITAVTASRSGKTVTVKAKPQYYAIGYGWNPITTAGLTEAARQDKYFKLQRRAANGRGPWKTVKPARAPKGKTITFKAKAKKRFQYRITFKETVWTFPSKSRTVRR